MSLRLPPDRPPNPDFEKARALDGPLASRLAAYDAALRARNPVAGAAYQGLVDHLKKAGVEGYAPAVGDPLPAFQLPDENGRLVALHELLAAGPVVISFNRGNWCPYCWLELCALQEVHSAIVATGAALVSITPEVATFSRRLKKRLDLDFPVLTDLDNAYALQLGLAVALTGELRDFYAKVDIDLGAFQRNEGWMLPMPATLIVDRKGIVSHAYVNADFRAREEPSRLPGLLVGL